jgi:hypothetical protein
MDAPLNAHAKPPSSLRDVYKEYFKLKAKTLETYPDLIQFDECSSIARGDVQQSRLMSLPADLREMFSEFLRKATDDYNDPLGKVVYEVPDVPGKIGSKPYCCHSF